MLCLAGSKMGSRLAQVVSTTGSSSYKSWCEHMCRASKSAVWRASCCAVQLAANFTCSDQRSLTFVTTNVQTVRPPRLSVTLGKQPPPSCGGKPAVAVFRYALSRVQAGQDFNLTTKVGRRCTADLTYGEFADASWQCLLLT
jgi:hypothetical protein